MDIPFGFVLVRIAGTEEAPFCVAPEFFIFFLIEILTCPARWQTKEHALKHSGWSPSDSMMLCSTSRRQACWQDIRLGVVKDMKEQPGDLNLWVSWWNFVGVIDQEFPDFFQLCILTFWLVEDVEGGAFPKLYNRFEVLWMVFVLAMTSKFMAFPKSFRHFLECMDNLPSLKLTAFRTRKWMVGRWVSLLGNHIFRGVCC